MPKQLLKYVHCMVKTMVAAVYEFVHVGEQQICE